MPTPLRTEVVWLDILDICTCPGLTSVTVRLSPGLPGFRQNVPDGQLLRRGMDLIEGSYNSISQSEEALP